MRPHIDFRRLRPQDQLELHHDASGDPVKLVYRQSPIHVVEATREGGDWAATRLEVPVDQRTVVVAGTLKDNLFESMDRLGERPQLVLDFAEIFAWDFDFAADSQPGDRFRMLVEKVFTGDQFVKYGRILAAEYESEGRSPHRSLFQGQERGRVLHAGRRIASAGVPEIAAGVHADQLHVQPGAAAPNPGRRAPAPGGGLRRAGWNSGVGGGGRDGGIRWVQGGTETPVIIRHRANFKTMYNHLSRFGKGIRAGVGVRQRQVIGYVGSTGLSTGPHLDYRVVKDGRFVNPLKQTFLPGLPISASSRGDFAQMRDSLLSQIRGTDVASALK